MFDTVFNDLLSAQNQPAGVELVFQNVPQPWHPQSAVMHEVAFAVRNVDEALFFPASRALFASQELFFDRNSCNKSRTELYKELVRVVSTSCFKDEAEIATFTDAVMKELEFSEGGSLNTGNSTTASLKFAVKYHRVRGVHVTPTVLLNGVEASDISSGWTAEQWRAKIAECTESQP